MTVLVTGGAGYIGSHMVHELVDAGEPVVVLDNLSTGFRFLMPSSVPFVAGGTGDRPLVADTIARHGITAIIHFAASIVVPESVADPLPDERRIFADASCEDQRVQSTERSREGADPLLHLVTKQGDRFRRPHVLRADNLAPCALQQGGGGLKAFRRRDAQLEAELALVQTRLSDMGGGYTTVFMRRTGDHSFADA